MLYIYAIYMLYIYICYIYICYIHVIYIAHKANPFLWRSRHLNTPRRQQSQRADFALHDPPEEGWEARSQHRMGSKYSKILWDMLFYSIVGYLDIFWDIIKWNLEKKMPLFQSQIQASICLFVFGVIGDPTQQFQHFHQFQQFQPGRIPYTIIYQWRCDGE